jgi:hypothetical protein
MTIRDGDELIDVFAENDNSENTCDFPTSHSSGLSRLIPR